jgi:hypothetical protein
MRMFSKTRAAADAGGRPASLPVVGLKEAQPGRFAIENVRTSASASLASGMNS